MSILKQTESVPFSSNEYQDASVSSNSQTETNYVDKAKESTVNMVDSVPRAFVGLTQAVKEDLGTSALVVSVVGYIIIATFGNIDPLRYLGYVLFLVFAFGLYKFINMPIKAVKKPNLILSIMSAVFFLIIVILLWKHISSISVDFYRFLMSHKK